VKNKIAGLNQTGFVYRLAGSRSAAAAEILYRNGFKDIYDMKEKEFRKLIDSNLLNKKTSNLTRRFFCLKD